MRTHVGQPRSRPPSFSVDRLLRRLFVALTCVFAGGCILLDIQIVQMVGLHHATVPLMLRAVLVQLEAYIAIVATIVTIRILFRGREA